MRLHKAILEEDGAIDTLFLCFLLLRSLLYDSIFILVINRTYYHSSMGILLPSLIMSTLLKDMILYFSTIFTIAQSQAM